MDVRDTVDATETIVKTVQTSFMELPYVANVRTQTESLTYRELEGLDEALRRIRGELVNNLAKLSDIDKDNEKEKRKLGEAEDEISKEDIKHV